MANKNERLTDREVHNLIFYSISLFIVAGLMLLGFSYDQYQSRVYIFATTAGTAAGILGMIQGCSRSAGLAVGQICLIAITFVLMLYMESQAVYDLLYQFAFYWGYSTYDSFILLWLLSIEFVIFFYLTIGIIFSNRVRIVLSKTHQSSLESRLV